jgi:signal transduction histidine kinase
MLAQDPVFARAYTQVENLIERNIQDYKRMQAYLSHDQKNKLAILKADPKICADEKTLRILSAISDSIDDFITLSEVGDDVVLENVDVLLICAAAADAYRNLAPVSFYFDENSSCLVRAKKRWVHSAVFNLVDNAVKYGLGKPVSISVYARAGSVIVQVRDEGAGIDEEELDKIFNHEYRIRNQHGDGYGLGLSLVSHICGLCRASVYVESEKGRGSTVYLSFPDALTPN